MGAVCSASSRACFVGWICAICRILHNTSLRQIEDLVIDDLDDLHDRYDRDDLNDLDDLRSRLSRSRHICRNTIFNTGLEGTIRTVSC